MIRVPLFLRLSVLALLAGCAARPEAPPPHTIPLPYVAGFSEAQPGGAWPRGWRPWKLSRLKKPTEYRLVEYDGRTVVKALADASASGLAHPLDVDPARYPLLQWRWKVPALIPSADNTRRHTEDAPVRVVVSFAGDIESLPLEERAFFDNVRALTGQQLPYATLMYIWENRAPREAVIRNPHTSRIRMIVADSGAERTGTWHTVTRNVYEDYLRAYGKPPGRITAIGIMTDTDNTGESVHAYYGDIVFRRIAPPRLVLAHD
jgi:hypothetical protein